MNRHMLRGNWNQLKGPLRKRWGQLTDADIEEIQGDPEVMLGKLEQRYGRSREELERELEDWLAKQRLSPDPSSPDEEDKDTGAAGYAEQEDRSRARRPHEGAKLPGPL